MLVSTRTAEIKFTNEMDSRDPSYCMVGIKVDELLYVSGQTVYDIGYTYTYHGEESSRKMIQPLYKEEDYDGVIVIKNAMTEIMVEYLLKDTDDLQQVTGTTTAQHYRLQIMRNLNMLWD